MWFWLSLLHSAARLPHPILLLFFHPENFFLRATRADPQKSRRHFLTSSGGKSAGRMRAARPATPGERNDPESGFAIPNFFFRFSVSSGKIDHRTASNSSEIWCFSDEMTVRNGHPETATPSVKRPHPVLPKRDQSSFSSCNLHLIFSEIMAFANAFYNVNRLSKRTTTPSTIFLKLLGLLKTPSGGSLRAAFFF